MIETCGFCEDIKDTKDINDNDKDKEDDDDNNNNNNRDDNNNMGVSALGHDRDLQFF